jgi:DNA-binding NarL/FixJ family response regulator
VLLDIGLPDIEGFEVARALSTDESAPMVVLTSSRDGRAYGRRLTNGHFLGFIPKEGISGAAIRALVDRP